MTNSEIAALTDLDLLKAALINRGAYGEVPPFMDPEELENRRRESLALSGEIRSRSLHTPRGQSIGRYEGEYTQSDHEEWIEAVEDWSGTGPAPVASDILQAG